MAAAATINGTRKFQTNTPEILALQFAEGREVKSNFGGVEYLFTFTDGTRAFFPLAAVEAFEAAHITARVPFQITKLTMGRWKVEVLGDTGTAGTAPASIANQRAQSSTNQPTDHNAAGVRQNALKAVLDAPRDEQYAPAASDASVLLEYAISDALAATRKFGVPFSLESLRAFAITLFIESNRKAAR